MTTVAAASATSTSSAAAQTFTVEVGNGDHKFKPDVIQAEVGDIVEFTFYPTNHSVVRAEYEYPCIPYEMTGKGKVGFWSGFHAVDAVLDNPPKYTLRVDDTNPVFFYCSAPDSCNVWGMVGVLNPNTTTSLATQRQIAQKAAYALSPGESFPSEAETPSSSSAPSAPSSPQVTSLPTSSHSSKLSPGAIAGIAIACVSVVVLGGLLAWFWGRFKGLRDEVKRKNSTVVRSTEPRSTWFLTSSSPSLYRSPPPPPPAISTPSPPYEAHTPMTSHAVPPAYYDAQYSTAPLQGGSPRDRSSRGVGRSASQRSVGGTFDMSPATGYYTRTHDGADRYRHTAPRTSDMTSPVDPGRGLAALMGGRVESSPPTHNPHSTTYPDEKAEASAERDGAQGAQQQQQPAEMPDTSVQAGKFF